MANIQFSVPVAGIDLKAAGIERTVHPADFSAIALEAIFAYGVRRWFQDHLNAAAHTFKRSAAEAAAKGELFNGGKPFDAAAAFTARLAAAKTGELSVRSAGSAVPRFTPFEETLYVIAVEVKDRLKPLKAAWNGSKGESTAARKAAILKAVAALPDATLAKLKAAAQTRLDAMSALDI